MKKMLTFALILSHTACGLSARDNEMVGQVKKVVSVTPVICGDYTEADVSLGVLRNGNGSTSKEDVELLVEKQEHVAILKIAAESGAAVKVNYDIRRIAWCTPDHEVTDVEILPDPGAKIELGK